MNSWNSRLKMEGNFSLNVTTEVFDSLPSCRGGDQKIAFVATKKKTGKESAVSGLMTTNNRIKHDQSFCKHRIKQEGKSMNNTVMKRAYKDKTCVSHDLAFSVC